MDKYSTLDSVVRQLMLEQGETTERRYPVFLAYAYAFLNGEYPAQEEGGKTLKTVLIEVGYDREARLPSDYVELVSVGRIVGNKVRTLSYNAALVPEGIMQSAAKAGYGDLGVAPQKTWPAITYWGWETLGLTGWDGCGYGWGEYDNEFVIDKVRGTILLSSALGGPDSGPLLLQYQSNDLAPGKPTPIHPYWQMALKEWMLWQWYEKAKEDLRLAGKHEANYYKQRGKAIKRTDPTNVYTELLNQIWENYNSVG